MRSRTNNLILVIAVGLCTIGCASKKSQPSGFLGDTSVYQSMKPHEELEGVMVYRSAPYPLAGYDSIIVPPVSIYLNEQGQKRGSSQEDLLELGEIFRNSVVKHLGSRYKVTNEPAPRVAILRLAITDADPNLAVMNIHPGSLIIGGGLGGASAEVDMLDSQSGRRVAALMASSKGKRYNYAAGLSKWGHTEEVLEEWAKQIGQRIEEQHG